MIRWLRRVHLHVGLFASTAVVVFGVAGLSATCDEAPGRTAPEPRRWSVAFEAPPGLDDAALMRAVHAHLGLPFTRPPADWTLRRDADGNLQFPLHTPNGSHRITVREAASRVDVASTATSLPRFLERMHSQTNLGHDDWRLRLWAAYVHASIFALLALASTGPLLWLRAQPRDRLGWAALAVSAGVLGLVLAGGA